VRFSRKELSDICEKVRNRALRYPFEFELALENEIGGATEKRMLALSKKNSDFLHRHRPVELHCRATVPLPRKRSNSGRNTVGDRSMKMADEQRFVR
jgi:hypothetical protein